MTFLRDSIATTNLTLLLGAKAEVVFGTLLVARNRAVLLACVLALVLGGVISVQEVERFPGAHQTLTAFLVVGTLSAVAGSRLFAPGAAFAASRRVVATWWLVPVGRLIGALSVILPVSAVTVFAMELTDSDPFLLALSAITYSAAVASFSFTLATIVGSSTAAVITLATIWVGVFPSAAVHDLAERWPVARQALILLADTLPIPPRADRLLVLHDPKDAIVLCGWISVGFVATCWVTSRPTRLRRKSGGRA